MKEARLIEKFIKNCFNEFFIDVKQYFWYKYDDVGYHECRWTDSEGNIDMEIVEYASEILGLKTEDILSTNYEAVIDIKKRYPCFDMLRDFEFAKEESLYGHGYKSMKIMEATFERKPNIKYPTRYDYADVKNRLLHKLKELNTIQPGIYHKNAKIKDLRIYTSNFCKYDSIKELCEHFISMGKELIKLFLSAVSIGLTDYDIRTYNLLVSIMGLKDKYYNEGYLYYNQLLNVKEIYKNTNEENIFDYISLANPSGFTPWACPDFVMDEDLVLEYVSVFPGTKGAMRKFTDAVSQFTCSFVWVDDEPADAEIYIGVEKYNYELEGNRKVIAQMKKYCRSVRLGGLCVKQTSYDEKEFIRRLMAIHGKIKKINYIKQTEKSFVVSGGDSNE